jgi:Lrp/AsnC family transcriptional regulator
MCAFETAPNFPSLRDIASSQFPALMRRSGGPELFRGADVDPVFISGHDDPMLPIVLIDAQRLDASGVIKRRIALLDPLKLGLGLTAFVSVQVGDHSGKAIARFAAMEEVMECYRMAAHIDHGLRVVVPDAATFDIFYKRLIETIPLKNVTSRFALENVKCETAFPIACQG